MAIRDFPDRKFDGHNLHYTCQGVPDKELDKRGIKKVWETFWMKACEVLMIPLKLFKKLGMFTRTSEECQINSEKILKTLNKK